ncbi:MAG: RHS repeat-associated core domain-containing protein, partial [archaeon]
GLEAKYSEDGLHYIHQDVLGSARATTDTAGVLVEENTFLPYGDALGASSERFGFTGKEDEGKLMYYGARYYDADTGRFTQADLIKDGRNWYGYAYNNPLIYVDPTGLEGEEAYRYSSNPEDNNFYTAPELEVEAWPIFEETWYGQSALEQWVDFYDNRHGDTPPIELQTDAFEHYTGQQSMAREGKQNIGFLAGIALDTGEDLTIAATGYDWHGDQMDRRWGFGGLVFLGVSGGNARRVVRGLKYVDEVPGVKVLGRIVGKGEAKKILRGGVLAVDRAGELVPCFDAPPAVRRRIGEMTQDQLRTLYRNVGGRAGESGKLKVVFFTAEAGGLGPIPQRVARWIREVKLPGATAIHAIIP